MEESSSGHTYGKPLPLNTKVGRVDFLTDCVLYSSKFCSFFLGSHPPEPRQARSTYLPLLPTKDAHTPSQTGEVVGDLSAGGGTSREQRPC